MCFPVLIINLQSGDISDSWSCSQLHSTMPNTETTEQKHPWNHKCNQKKTNPMCASTVRDYPLRHVLEQPLLNKCYNLQVFYEKNHAGMHLNCLEACLFLILNHADFTSFFFLSFLLFSIYFSCFAVESLLAILIDQLHVTSGCCFGDWIR